MLTVPFDLAKPETIQPLPNPSPINVVGIKWVVITPKTLPQGDNWVLYALTPKDYENLSRTNADTIRWVSESQWRLNLYTSAGNNGSQK